MGHNPTCDIWNKQQTIQIHMFKVQKSSLTEKKALHTKISNVILLMLFEIVASSCTTLDTTIYINKINYCKQIPPAHNLNHNVDKINYIWTQKLGKCVKLFCLHSIVSYYLHSWFHFISVGHFFFAAFLHFFFVFCFFHNPLNKWLIMVTIWIKLWLCFYCCSFFKCDIIYVPIQLGRKKKQKCYYFDKSIWKI
jgi:ABC-type multidrug transport system permease subunit